jgi:MFS family permease
VFLTGVAGFAGASVLCAIAPGIDALIGARSLQGIGGALMLPASLAIIQSSFRPAPAPIDWAGSLLAIVALAAGTYVLMVTPGWRSAAVALIAATVIAVGACAAFVWHERRSPAPMLPAAVFRSVPFITANLVAFFVYGAFGAFSLVFTIALETISGYSPLKAGSTILPVTVITLALSGPSGQLSARLGPRLQLSAGPVLCAVAALLAARVSASTGYWKSVIPLECVFGLGIAATVPPLTSTMLHSIPGDHAGIASGMTNAVTRAASLIWIAALPPLAGLSGSAYASAAARRGGYREICVICAAGLALAGALAVLTPARHWRQCARS